MKFTTAIVMAGSGVALWAAPALAQGRPLPPPKPLAHTQTGTAQEKAPPPTPEAPRGNRYERNGYGYGGGYGNRRWQIERLPAQVAVDGRVYANFGSGLVLVPSQCSVSAAPGTGATSSAVVQPQVTQPVPQPILQPVPGAGQQAGSQSVSGRTACWSRDANGKTEVLRYY